MDRTNIFFLVIGAGLGYFAFQEYRKQQAAQRKLRLAQKAQTGVAGYPMDYAEMIQRGYM